jgi:H+/Cl- antiporter ClcA
MMQLFSNAQSQKIKPAAMLNSWWRWLLLGSGVGLLSGTASAFFLTALTYVTDMRLRHGWLLFLLPLGGALVSFLYLKVGKTSGKGNNLILEQIHDGQEAVPLRMAPLVLAGTLITHLFGGSAGREGTAVQMGGSLADSFGRLLRVPPATRRILLICGISGGFGSVFGTPLAGTVFSLEVLAIGLISHEALLPAFVASLVGHLTTTSLWGVPHLHYSMGAVPELTLAVAGKVVIAAVIFGLVSLIFSELTHFLKKWSARLFANPMLKSFVGGIAVIVLVYAVGTRDYLGLGIPLIQDAFSGGASLLAFAWKLLFTAVTLGTGFQGGEVTPLFAIGATLGQSLSGLLQLPAPFLAGLGFIAVFCGAANTPIACFIMGIELFGSQGALYMFMACLISYLVSGHTGIYTSQRIGSAKFPLELPANSSLSQLTGLLPAAKLKKDNKKSR